MGSSNLAKYKSTVVKPDDFQEFWNQTLRETELVELNPRLSLDPMRSNDDVEVFTARYASYESLEIAGWYARPRNYSEPLPGLLFVPGYVSEPKLPTDLARDGYAVFSAAPRNKLRSNTVFNPGYPGLLTHNIESRATYGYRGFYMDAVRAFDFLSQMPEVDERRLGVLGGSQGGALTLLVSSLRNKAVAAASAGAPYLCSMMDSASLTRTYPYEEINDYLRLNPESEAVVRDTLNLYDIHNFVDQIECPIIVNIGLKDDVCPPETGFAVFERIGSDNKQLYPYKDCGHESGAGQGHGKVITDFFAKILSPNPVGPSTGAFTPEI